MPNAENRFMHYLLTEHRFEQDGHALLDDYFQYIASRKNVAPRNQTEVDLHRRDSSYRKGRRLRFHQSASAKSMADSKSAQASHALG